MSDQIPPPAVPSAVYDEAYYRHCCAGADTWEASQGREIHGLNVGMAERIGIRQGETVIDLGTGRGEFVVVALDKGAARAIGVEYSEDALKLARQTLEAHTVTDRAEVLQADVRRSRIRMPISSHCSMWWSTSTRTSSPGPRPRRFACFDQGATRCTHTPSLRRPSTTSRTGHSSWPSPPRFKRWPGEHGGSA